MSVPGVGGQLDWSPTGDVFVTEGSDGSGVVDIRDVETGRSIRSFPGHDGDVTDVAFSPDGSMLATTGVDGFLKVWDPSDGALLDEVSGVGEARGPSFSDDGRLVAAAWPEEGAVRVVNTSTDRVVRTFEDLRGANGTSFGPGGARIAVSTFSERGRHEQRGLPARPAELGASSWSTRLPGDRWRCRVEPRRRLSWPRGPTTTLTIWDAATGELRYSSPATPRRSRASIGGRIRQAACW